jgi:spore maturation protein B
LEAFTNSLRPVLGAIGFPPELLPLALLRSLSGSGSLGIFTDLVGKHGADSFIGRTAATMYGSSETTFYVIAVYFGSVGIRKTRHAVLAGLGADLVAVIATVVTCRWMFGP